MEAWASSTGVHTTTTTVAAAHSGKGRGGESATEMPPAVLAYEVCCVHSVNSLQRSSVWVLGTLLHWMFATGSNTCNSLLCF